MAGMTSIGNKRQKKKQCESMKANIDDYIEEQDNLSILFQNRNKLEFIFKSHSTNGLLIYSQIIRICKNLKIYPDLIDLPILQRLLLQCKANDNIIFSNMKKYNLEKELDNLHFELPDLEILLRINFAIELGRSRQPSSIKSQRRGKESGSSIRIGKGSGNSNNSYNTIEGTSPGGRYPKQHVGGGREFRSRGETTATGGGANLSAFSTLTTLNTTTPQHMANNEYFTKFHSTTTKGGANALRQQMHARGTGTGRRDDKDNSPLTLHRIYNKNKSISQSGSNKSYDKSGEKPPRIGNSVVQALKVYRRPAPRDLSVRNSTGRKKSKQKSMDYTSDIYERKSLNIKPQTNNAELPLIADLRYSYHNERALGSNPAANLTVENTRAISNCSTRFENDSSRNLTSLSMYRDSSADSTNTKHNINSIIPHFGIDPPEIRSTVFNRLKELRGEGNNLALERNDSTLSIQSCMSECGGQEAAKRINKMRLKHYQSLSRKFAPDQVLENRKSSKYSMINGSNKGNINLDADNIRSKSKKERRIPSKEMKELISLLMCKLKKAKVRFNKFKKEEFIKSGNISNSKEEEKEEENEEAGGHPAPPIPQIPSPSDSNQTNSSVYNTITIYAHNAINNNISLENKRKEKENKINSGEQKENKIRDLTSKIKEYEIDNKRLNQRLNELRKLLDLEGKSNGEKDV